MSFKRQMQRRAGLPRSQVRDALIQTQEAVQALQGFDFTNLGKAVRALEEQSTRVEQLAGALAEDYETLDREIELQREVAIRLRAGATGEPVDEVRALEGQIRKEILAERESENAENIASEEA